MSSNDQEKLEWAADLLRDWNSEEAHRAACEYLSNAAKDSADPDVRLEANCLLTWAEEHGMVS